jgi:RHS repeat-associated protein
VFKGSNQLVSWYSYTTYGDILNSYINTDIAYKFTGQEYDNETNLWNFRARLYDSGIERFYASDPAGQGFAPFAYCGNNPVMSIDKDGRFPWVIVGLILAGGVTNVTAHWHSIHNFGDGLVAFGVGAGAAAVGIYAGAAALATSAVAGVSTFVAGAVSGAIAYGFSSTLQAMGNTLYFNDPIPNPVQQWAGLFVAAATGGIINKLATPEPVVGVPDAPELSPSIPAPKINTQPLELPTDPITPEVPSSSVADELPEQGPVKLMQGENVSVTHKYSVYVGVDKSGDIKYVGMTGRNPTVRWDEHAMALGSGRESLDYQVIQRNLTKAEARLIEQEYINQYGLSRNSGQLLNKINSISPK